MRKRRRARIARKHAGDFEDARIALHGRQAGNGKSVVAFALAHHVMRIGTYGHLRKMGDDDDLMGLRKAGEHIGQSSRHRPSDACIDLVEHERFPIVYGTERHFAGKHDAADLAAGRDAGQRPGRHGFGRTVKEFDRCRTRAGPAGVANGCCVCNWREGPLVANVTLTPPAQAVGDAGVLWLDELVVNVLAEEHDVAVTTTVHNGLDKNGQVRSICKQTSVTRDATHGVVGLLVMDGALNSVRTHVVKGNQAVAGVAVKLGSCDSVSLKAVVQWVERDVLESQWLIESFLNVLVKALAGASTSTKGVDANPLDAVTEDTLAEAAAFACCEFSLIGSFNLL